MYLLYLVLVIAFKRTVIFILVAYLIIEDQTFQLHTVIQHEKAALQPHCLDL